jgi:MscS family membrane protein
MQLPDFLYADLFLGNTLGHLAGFVLAVFLSFALASIAQSIFHGRLSRLAQASDTDLDDALLAALERPLHLLVLALGLRMSVMLLEMPEGLATVVGNVLTVVVTVFGTWGLSRMLDTLRALYVDPFVEASETKLDDQLVPILDRTLKVTLWSLAILMVFSSLGYDILSLLTGLGIGGLAVAMAAQATLSNVVGSITIFADQPFQVDDLVQLGDHRGVVREVGLRTCRIETFEGHVVSVPNASVVDQPVLNLSPGDRWRYAATLGLVYDTTSEQLQEAMGLLRLILTDHPAVDPDVAVRFTAFGDSALELTFAYWVRDPTAGRYLDTLSEINLAIKERFDAAGLSMAFPSVSLYVEKTP